MATWPPVRPYISRLQPWIRPRGGPFDSPRRGGCDGSPPAYAASRVPELRAENWEGGDGKFADALSSAAPTWRGGNNLAGTLHLNFRGVAQVCQSATAQSRP